MKVLIVSGFLGAGKTTFIRELSEKTGKKFVILENEYGQIGIDGDMLKASSSNIWEMTSGCICCSKKGDFAASVLTISNTINPDYLIIEPTGVGMLSNVIGAVQKVEYDRIKILAPVTIVDGNSLDRYEEEFPAIYQDQIKYASVIAVSKTVNKSVEEKQIIERKLREINKKCEIVFDPIVKEYAPWWVKLLKITYDGKIIEEFKEDLSSMETVSFSNVTMESESSLIVLLENIIRYKYGNIIRGKGSLKIGKTCLKFDLVDKNYSILICDEIKASRLVFIGTNIDEKSLKDNFIEEFMGIRLEF